MLLVDLPSLLIGGALGAVIYWLAAHVQDWLEVEPEEDK